MSILFNFIQAQKDKAYDFGYEVGFFIGQNLILIVVISFLLLAGILYYIFRAQKKRKLENLQDS